MNFLSNIRLVFSLLAMGFFVPTEASASVPTPDPTAQLSLLAPSRSDPSREEGQAERFGHRRRNAGRGFSWNEEAHSQ